MAKIIFRELPGVAAVERQLDMHFRDRLHEDELEGLPHLIRRVCQPVRHHQPRHLLLGVPDPVRRAPYGRNAWEEQFDVLGEYSADANARWRAFNLDLSLRER